MSKEALKLALEVLENNRQAHHYCEDTWYSCPKHEDGCANDAEGDECNCGADKANAEIDKAITAINEALAQPKQKPEMVGRITDNIKDMVLRQEVMLYTDKYLPIGTPVYTTPPQRNPLTDEQIEATFTKCGGKWNGDQWVIEDADLHPFVRTIEHPELNTLRAISDEYNAWIKHHAAGHTYDDFLAKRLAAHGIKEEV